MNEKRAFLIGGGGTLGGYASVELLKAGWSVDVLAPEPLPSLTRRLRHFRGTADDATLREIFARNRYDVVVDFLHYRDSDAYRARADFLLDNTDQLVFLSSYRVYAGARDPEPITETSPLLLDVAPAEFAVQDRYAAQLLDLAAIVRGEKPNDQDYDRDLRVHELVLRMARGESTNQEGISRSC